MGNITYHRDPHKKDFTCLSNDVLKDKNISFKGKGLFAYILSLPDNWVLYKSELQNHCTDGRSSIDSGLDELCKNGYIKILQKSDSKLVFQIIERPRIHLTVDDAENQQHIYEAVENRQMVCAESTSEDVQNQHLLNTNLNTTTNYSEVSSSNSNNLRRVMKELGLSVSNNFYSNFKSFADSHNLTDEQSENYIRWIYETKKKSAHNINSFIYKIACMENLLEEYLGSVQRKTETNKKIFCKHCGKEQTFQEQRESSCHGCGKDYFDFSQFANTKVLHHEEHANGSDNISTD